MYWRITILSTTIVRANSSEGGLEERCLQSKWYAFDAAEEVKVLPIELMFPMVGSSPAPKI